MLFTQVRCGVVAFGLINTRFHERKHFFCALGLLSLAALLFRQYGSGQRVAFGHLKGSKT